ncbi:Adaptive-response sensory-kinase SasA [compost metagenome]
MELQFNSYSVVLISSGLATFFISYLIFKRLGGTVRWFSLLMFFIGLWAVTYGMELSCQTLPDMLFWINLEYIGIALLPASWIIFIINFIGKEQWLKWHTSLLIFLIPLITISLVWTNSLHHLHYASVSIDKNHSFPLLNIKPGIWYKCFTVYFYFLLAWGCFLLINRFKRADSIYKKQNSSILLGAFIPWIVNLLYLLGIRPNAYIDLTPYAFIATGFLISIGLLKYRLFDIIPIAREKVIGAMHDGLLILDQQDRVIDYNKNILRFLDLSPSPTIIGVKLSDLIPANETLIKLVSERSNCSVEIQLGNNNKRSFFDVSITSLFQRDTIYSGVVLIFRDITILKNDAFKLMEQSEQLSGLNQLKNRVFTIISHDLRTPVRQLGDILNMTIKGMISDDELNMLLPELAKSVNQTSNVLDNLLFWSKTQMEGEHTDPEVLDLHQKVLKEIAFLSARSEEKKVTIECKLEPETTVYADKEMTRLIIRNLLDNALKFSNPENIIVVRARKTDEKQVEVCVEDSGTGIRADLLSKLFCPNSFSMPGTNNEQGTGLGLLICKDFVEKNYGKIWAESTWLQGSRFYFTLPIANQANKRNPEILTSLLDDN